VLDVVSPHSLAPVAIGPKLSSPTFHFAVNKLSLISCVIGPDHNSVAHNIVQVELTLIDLPCVGEIVLSFTFELPVLKITLKVVALKFKAALSSLL